jgi:toxin FitB
VSFVVVDTDVASAMFRGRVPTPLAARLAGRTPAVTFVTIGELTKWTLVRHWGPRRTEDIRGFMSQLLVLPYSEAVARTWGELQARAQMRGRPRPANDAWIASCCLTRRLPLAMLNVKDFQDFVERDGLEIINGS